MGWDTGITREALQPGDEIFGNIVNHFYSRLEYNAVGSPYRIKKIERVWNPALHNKYKKLFLEQEDWTGGLYYHGTPTIKNIENIICNNFDRFVPALNGRKFGEGIYFSEKPEVAITYSGVTQQLLLCHVLHGEQVDGTGGTALHWTTGSSTTVVGLWRGTACCTLWS